MKWFTSLAISLLMALSAMADPQIVGPDKVEPYKLVRLKAADLPEKAGVLWDVMPVGKADLASSSDRSTLEFVAPPGTYQVELLVATVGKDGIPILSRVRKPITIGNAPDPKPDPDPGPKPDPKPDPDPTPVPPAKAWVVVVEETSDAAAERGKILTDKNLSEYVKGKGWKVRVVDKDVKDSQGQVPADLRPYFALAGGKQLPQMFIVDQDGKVRFQGLAPKTAAEVLAILKKVGG